ncbi:MAG: aminodeoxychorismate/anthranilate synthase component II [Rhodospirillaceae bacterium]|nr:aminodeoxychorismate/anthranilate synthase component II [Rhodospirillaceae bacterium]|tara:strand:+ start:232 stop:819 length:588 start_codon:yes stop_codon:yes gene_type:complete
MLLIIDNYDSFTYNLVQYLGELGAKTIVRRNDAISAKEAINMDIKGILISPGPCEPEQAGICLELVEMASRKIPILGVCLGHQAISQAFGGKIIRAETPMHGKPSKIFHTNTDIFSGLRQGFSAIRYHSLIVERKTLPDTLKITAETNNKTIMAVAHKQYPVFGVQFHPESIDTDLGHVLLSNFIDLTEKRGDTK